jgi:hypothetical protein
MYNMTDFYRTITFEVLSNDFKSGKMDFETFYKEIVELVNSIKKLTDEYNQECKSSIDYKTLEEYLSDLDFEKNYDYIYNKMRKIHKETYGGNI